MHQLPLITRGKLLQRQGAVVHSMELLRLTKEKEMGSGGQALGQKRCRSQQFEVMLVSPDMERVKGIWMACPHYLLHKGIVCFVFEHEKLEHVYTSRGGGQQKERNLRFRKKGIDSYSRMCQRGGDILNLDRRMEQVQTRWAMPGGGKEGEKDGRRCRQFFRVRVERLRSALCHDFKLSMNYEVVVFSGCGDWVFAVT